MVPTLRSSSADVPAAAPAAASALEGKKKPGPWWDRTIALAKVTEQGTAGVVLSSSVTWCAL
eukprot:460442-Amphidinium_carterae.1